MKTSKRPLYRNWRMALMLLSIGLITYALYFHRLGSLLPGYSSLEVTAFNHSASWHNIITNPVNAPYKLVVWAVASVLHHQSLIATRLVASIFGAVAVLLFFTVIRPWYSYRTAFFATVLFATSAGLLHYARLGSGQILQLGVLAFIGGLLWYRRHASNRVIKGYAIAVLFAVLCYVPGMVWFELFGIVLMRRGIFRQLRLMPRLQTGGWALVFLVVLAPLVAAGIKQPHLLTNASGIPPTLQALGHTPKQLVSTVASVGVRSNGNPMIWLGHAPLLDSIDAALFVVGAYYLVYRRRSVRTAFLLGSIMLGLVLISFGGTVGFAVLVPLLYLVIAGGIEYVLGEWLRVFPRNPIARAVGVSIVCLMLGFSVLYQTRSYFVAWPHTAATRRVFTYTKP